MAGDELELRVAWERSIGRDEAADRWFDDVVARHREPHRHYHGLQHVRWVVRHALRIAQRPDVSVDDVDAVVGAAFFHDAVYEPARTDNEAASARLAVRALADIGWSARRSGTVGSMISATAHHTVEAGDADAGHPIDTAVLLAADLAVLAADAGAYGDYVRGVRREYAHVTDDHWIIGRTAVLRAFLDRPAIFDPSLGLTDWERRARANLTAELATLER